MSSASPVEAGPKGLRRRIFLVEDNKADVFLVREALAAAKLEIDLLVVHDGERAIRFLSDLDADDASPVPEMVILDLNLPKRHGGEVLRFMRLSRRCVLTPVLVVTSSDSESEREAMARMGADGYFRKPSDYEGFVQLGEIVRELLAHTHGASQR